MWIRTAGKMLTILLGISVTSAGAQAGQQYFAGTGHWYEAVHTPQGITWGDASTAATARGGHLATVHSDAENQFILGLVNDSRYWNMDPEHTPWGPWLGGYQASGSAEPSAGWQWVTGESFSYTNWRPPQPDNGWEIEDRLHMYDSFPGGSGRWNDQCGSWPLNSYIVEYPANSSSKQNYYLDFSSYTAPAGYGSTEQIATEVKAAVASKFSQDGLTFYTSFDGSSPNPNITSVIHIGGTNASATVLGSAAYDPGNSNRSDAGYVYSDQEIFGSLPIDSMEYKNMLANTTAHEIGHLLGYGHGDAAGMPFMLIGDAMEARIRQDMLLGELGQATQQRMTYVADTDYDATAPLPMVVYVPKTSATPEQQQQMMQEMEDFYRDAGGDELADLERAWCTVSDIEGIVETALTGSWKPDPIFDGGCLVLQLNNHPEYVEFFFGAIHFGDKPNELDLDSDLTFIQPEWDEALGGYVFRFDGLTEEEILGSDISLTFMAPDDDINDFTLRFLESDLTDVGGASFVVQNVPEPATLLLLAFGGLALLRRKRR